MVIGRKKDEYFDKLETMSIGSREKYLNQRIASVITYSYHHAPAVQRLLDSASVKPSDIRTVKDLEKLPITRKNDLIEMQKTDPPYGGFLMIPPEEVERVFISPGPVYEPLHTSSIQWFAKAFHAAGFKKSDIVVNTFTYHLSPAGILFHEGLRDCGATVIPMGTGNTDILIKTMRDLKVTGFLGTPSFLMAVIKRAEELGFNFIKDFCVEIAWFTGEMLPQSLRSTFELTYQIATRQAYAVTEPGGAIAYECHEKYGMHIMDDYVLEIVDPHTGEQLGPEEVGEIVVTPIHNKTWGLIRFGTGDLSSYIASPCICGRTAYRLSGIVGRTGDALKVRGMFIVAKQAEEVISGFANVAKFQMIVSRKDNRDETTLKLELKDETADKDKLAKDINQKFQETCRLRIDAFDFIPRGAIPEGAKSLVDERRWE